MSNPKPSLHKVSVWVLGSIAALIPFCLGGVPDWSVWSVGVLLGALALFELIRDPRQLTVWLFPPAIAVAYYVIQIIPLPIDLLGYISPLSAEWYSETGQTVGALSLNRYETMLSAVLQAAFVCSVFLGSRISDRQVRKVLTTLAASAAVMSLLGLVHLFFNWNSVFNLYQPYDIPNPRGFVTAFVNDNTAAGFLCLGVALNLGLTFKQPRASRARLTMLGALLCGMGVLLTASKSGLIALTSLIFIWIYCLYLHPKTYRNRERAPYRSTLIRFLAPATIIAMTVFIFAPDMEGSAGWWNAFEQKIKVWHSIDYLKDFWVTGSGRGSFEVVYPIYQLEGINGTVTHAENILFQTIGEAGVFAGVFIIAWAMALVYHLTPSMLSSYRPLKWSLWGALMVITIQQLVDFGLESAGLAVPFAICLGRILRYRPNFVRIKWLLVSVALAPMSLLAFNGGQPRSPINENIIASLRTCEPLEKTVSKVKELAKKSPTDYLIFENGLRNILVCHPKDWKLALAMANKAQKRHPTRGEIRLLTAELFARHGYLAQAAVELKASVSLAPWIWSRARRTMQQYLMTYPNLLFEAVGTDSGRRSSMFGYLAAKGELETAQSFLNAWILNGLESTERLKRQSTICIKQKAIDCLESVHGSYEERQMAAHANIIAAWIKHIQNDNAGARDALTLASSEIDNLGLGFATFGQRLARQLKNIELARVFLRRQWNQSPTPIQRADVLLKLSRAEEDLGDLEQSIQALNLAYRLRPKVEILLRALNLELKSEDAKACSLRLEDIRRYFPATANLSKLESRCLALRTATSR